MGGVDAALELGVGVRMGLDVGEVASGGSDEVRGVLKEPEDAVGEPLRLLELALGWKVWLEVMSNAGNPVPGGVELWELFAKISGAGFGAKEKVADSRGVGVEDPVFSESSSVVDVPDPSLVSVSFHLAKSLSDRSRKWYC